MISIYLNEQMSIAQLLEQAKQFLMSAELEPNEMEPNWILADLLQISTTQLSLKLNENLSAEIVEHFQDILQKRFVGEPLQYLLGTVPFHQISLKVGRGVLIPRPETEELVEWVLKEFSEEKRIVDVCSGSGAIALALAYALPQVEILATELSQDALIYAKENAQQLHLSSVKFYTGDLLNPLIENNEKVNIIVSNPPYISMTDYLQLEHEVLDFEPQMALTDGGDGLSLIRRLAQDGKKVLLPQGKIFCEIGSEQGKAVLDIFVNEGWQEVKILQDLTGRDRILYAKL